ncbi:MAG: hypothetical protein GX995_10100, partial [Clostridiales bacterium]|nr:hypothetical protein [Clostridiales bacterium]
QNNSVDKYVDATLGNNEIPEYLVISAEEILAKLKTVDGEDSGLDADMLDGKHGSEFATKEDIEGISIDGDTIVQNINTSTSIIDDKNLSANVNDSISKKHDHSNKSILDTITQALIDGWNNAVAHISDKIKHITSSERALWNTVSNKSDKGHTHMESDITNLDKYTKAETDTRLGTKADKTYVDNELANKVDKITGKGLSTEDYTTAEKTKLSNIEDGAEKNKVDSVNSKTGDVVINKADIGLSNVENKSSATIRNEITKTNVTNALGYTPENSSNKGVANGYAPLDSNIKIPLAILPDIAKQQTYVVDTIADRDILTGLIMGEKCYIVTTGDSYIWDGSKWQILAKADWENVNLQWTNILGKPSSNVDDIDDATSKRHTHSNKSIIDTVTQTLIDRWNSAWTHISDTIKHITSAERTKWNTVENKADTTYVNTELNKKVDKIAGKQLSTEDYTTTEKNKLSGIESGANKYILPVATENVVGGVKAGSNLSVSDDGTLHANDNPSSFIVKQEMFVVEEGQTVFNLAQGNYKPNTNTISVYIYGGKQPNIAITELSSTSFRINEPLEDGAVILVEYFEIINIHPYPHHAHEHLTDGIDAIPKTTNTQDGLMSKEDKIKLDTIEQGANKYTHPKTHSLDMITETSDKKILTASERSKIAEIDNKVDKVSGKGLSDENYTTAEKNKLAGIEAGANKYTHPSNHPASMITESATKRFVTDTEKNTWNTVTNKADKTYVDTELGKKANSSTVSSHIGDKTNPHGVTKSQVGLGNVENKSSATIRSEITRANVESGLGYTPIKDGGDVPEFKSGLESARPSATGSGIVYFSVDTQKIWKDTANGQWTQMGGQDLPIATKTTLGGIKVGANLSITADGTLSAVDDDSKSTFIVKQELFTATEGQTIFNLTKGYYQPNTNTISVYLYGGKQPNIALNEISSSSFEITEPLKAGDVILVEYIELSSATPYPIHGNDHITGGYDPIPKATVSSDGLMAKEDKAKLNGIATGATKNDTDVNLKNRANHTGTQSSSTISDFASTVRNTVLTGLSTATNAVITTTDTVLSALGKLQKQISNNLSALDNKEDKLGYIPVNKSGDTMNGDLKVNGEIMAGTELVVGYNGTTDSLKRHKFKYNGSTGYLELWRYSRQNKWELSATFPNRNTGSGGLTVEGKAVAFADDVNTALANKVD